MGTRSLTVFHEYDDEIVVMYRQMDGYPEGHGRELAEFLTGMTVVNGLTVGQERIANGMSCLAAQVIAHFKKGPGGIYLHKAGTRGGWEEYIYRLSCPTKTGEIKMECWRVPYEKEHPQIFEGTPEEFVGWLEQEEKEVA